MCSFYILFGSNVFNLTACVCASFYATLHDHVTNYSFWWSFCPFTFCFEIFNLSLLFIFTNFSPSHCHAMSPSRGFLTSTVLREGLVRAPLSKACRLTMGHTEPPGAHSHWGAVLKFTIHYHLQLRLAQAQACIWTALL